MNTSVAIGTVLRAHPSITTGGYGLYQGPHLPPVLNDPEDSYLSQKFEVQQLDIFSQGEVFEKVCSWLSNVKKSSTIHGGPSNRIAELMEVLPEVGEECFHGTFIVAALHSGFEMEVVEGRGRVLFNFDAETIEQAIPERWRRYATKH